mmetsp:Transcript_23719/g.68022  ORF Transcript_23719/g.68022 Transcript_23719/m.68022 type:complete len:771 (+) Transcript_23719:1949-4261(+)
MISPIYSYSLSSLSQILYMAAVPQMAVKRNIDDVNNAEYPEPVREISPTVVIINEIIQLSQHAIDVMSRYSSKELYDYRVNKSGEHIAFTDFDLAELNLPGTLPLKKSLHNVLSGDDYQYMPLTEFVEGTHFVNYSTFINNNRYRTSPINIKMHTRDIEYARFFRANAHELISEWTQYVPLEFGNIKITPEQIMAGLSTTVPLPVDAVTTIDDTSIVVKAGTFPTILTYTAMPGAGKTCACMAAARFALQSERCYEAYQTMNQSQFNPLSGGFYEYREINTLLSVICFMTPTPLMKQTIAAAHKFMAGADITVWVGLTHGTLKEAHAHGRPIFWVLPQDQRTTKMLINSKGYSYYADYIDEMNTSMTKRGDPAKANPMQTVIIQATPKKLIDSTINKPNAILRTEFCRPKHQFDMTDSFTNACMRNSMLPDWIRIAWNKKAVAMMPDGYHIHNVMAKSTNLNRIFGKENAPLAPRSMADNISSLVPIRNTTFNQETMNSFVARANAGVSPPELLQILRDMRDAISDPAREHNTINSLARTIINMTGVVDQSATDPPECPVLLEPIPVDKAAILPCCSNVLHVDALAGLQRRVCPMCRAPLHDTFTFGTADVRTPMYAHDYSGPLEDGLKQLSNARLTAVNAVENTIRNVLARKPDARIILSSYNATDSRDVITGFCNDIKRDHPNLELYFIGSRGKKFDINRYNDPSFTNPQIAVLNTSTSSNNSQGLDLHNTYVTIVIGRSRSDIKAQLIGRCCRTGTSGTRVLVNVEY